MKPETYFSDIGAWPHASGHLVRTYVLGFLFSLVLTLVGFEVASHPFVSRDTVLALLLLLACAQFGVQLACFLHLDDSGSKERMIALLCAVLIVLILVVGSLWIMFHLNARMMPSPSQMEQYMNDQQGI